MKHRIIPVTPFQQNCSLIWCEETKKAALIDPGGDIPKLAKAIAAEGVQIEKLLLTHGHIDHVGATAELARQWQVPIVGPHHADDYWIQLLPEEAEMFGFPPTERFTPQQWLNDGDKVRVGNIELDVIHCPGHTPGHVVFYHATGRLAFVGDVLFKGSIGRTDFPGGDHPSLLRSIKSKLFPLGDDITFVPGHGPCSTFGHERRTNPFLK